MPQISVVSYDTTLVKDSNYNPGVSNLKMVEEKAKGRTAQIVINGQGVRESFRVAAFDVMSDGKLVPGISLKKALFNAMRDRIGSGEDWTADKNGSSLSIEDSKLKWMRGGPKEYPYASASNQTGNSWRSFETMIKSYTDDTGKPCYIETIKRLYALKKYNPFDPTDNPNYNPSELLPEAQITKMQYWIILHNGRYFEGDINDPIWPGERYELVCVNIGDFSSHFKNYYYSPLQSMDSFSLNTRWNALSNNGEFARAKYLGQLVPGDIVHLVVNLKETRNLFYNRYFNGCNENISGGQAWTLGKGNYTFGAATTMPNGIPKGFTHAVYAATNGFEVDIDNAENAWYYDITITGKSAPSFKKNVRISASELKQNGNVVFIDRNSPDVDPSSSWIGTAPYGSSTDSIGYIPGAVFNAGGHYIVKVAAKGYVYGVAVSTQSTTNSDNNIITVKNAPSGVTPSGFTFTANGMTNQVQISVGDSKDAEFYEAQIDGPLNSCYSTENKSKKVSIHRGYNYVALDNPAVSVSDPGIYRVTVSAQNQTTAAVAPSIPTTATNGEMNIVVSYDRYASQKSDDTCPMVSSDLEKLDAVDLEVNFNDGNGWFTLQTYGVDGDLDGRKAIDCRASSYVDFAEQTFHLFFTPPAGPSAGLYPSIYNVFAGGRETADVYIRTVTKPKYRDSFWPKPNTLKILTQSGLSGDHLVSLVTSSSLFDATNIESLSSFLTTTLGFSGTHPLYYSPAADTGCSSFFFAPALERNYSIYAGITNEMTLTSDVKPDQPLIGDVVPTTEGIEIRNIVAKGHTNRLKVYYASGAPKDVGTDVLHNWVYVGDASADTSDPIKGQTYKISNLIKNQPYTVAVMAYSSAGYSDPVIWTKAVSPYGTVSTQQPILSLSTQSNYDRRIIVDSSFYIQGETRYQIWYKDYDPTAGAVNTDDTNDATWAKYDTYTDGNFILNVPMPQMFDSEKLQPWSYFKFRVRAVSLGAVGAISGNCSHYQDNTDGNGIKEIAGPWSDIIISNVTGAPTQQEINKALDPLVAQGYLPFGINKIAASFEIPSLNLYGLLEHSFTYGVTFYSYSLAPSFKQPVNIPAWTVFHPETNPLAITQGTAHNGSLDEITWTTYLTAQYYYNNSNPNLFYGVDQYTSRRIIKLSLYVTSRYSTENGLYYTPIGR